LDRQSDKMCFGLASALLTPYVGQSTKEKNSSDNSFLFSIPANCSSGSSLPHVIEVLKFRENSIPLVRISHRFNVIMLKIY